MAGGQWVTVGALTGAHERRTGAGTCARGGRLGLVAGQGDDLLDPSLDSYVLAGGSHPGRARNMASERLRATSLGCPDQSRRRTVERGGTGSRRPHLANGRRQRASEQVQAVDGA